MSPRRKASPPDVVSKPGPAQPNPLSACGAGLFLCARGAAQPRRGAAYNHPFWRHEKPSSAEVFQSFQSQVFIAPPIATGTKPRQWHRGTGSPHPGQGAFSERRRPCESLGLSRRAWMRLAAAPASRTIREPTLNKHLSVSPRPLAKALITLLALGAAPAFAQSTTGSIFGQVPANGGEAVQIKSSTGIARTVTIDNRGRYSASELPLGTYTVSLLRDGKVVDTRGDISLRVGAGTEVSFEPVAAKDLGAVSVSASTTPPIDATTV